MESGYNAAAYASPPSTLQPPRDVRLGPTWGGRGVHWPIPINPVIPALVAGTPLSAARAGGANRWRFAGAARVS